MKSCFGNLKCMFRIDTEVIFIKYVVKENTHDF